MYSLQYLANTTHKKKKKHSKIIPTMMEYRHFVCVYDQAHSTPKWGWTDRGIHRLQKGLTVNSNTVVLDS